MTQMKLDSFLKPRSSRAQPAQTSSPPTPTPSHIKPPTPAKTTKVTPTSPHSAAKRASKVRSLPSAPVVTAQQSPPANGAAGASAAEGKRKLEEADSSIENGDGKRVKASSDVISTSSLASLLIEPSWKAVLDAELAKGYITKISKFLDKEEASGKVLYPPRHQVFNALNKCSFDNVRVVILGQDPYHQPRQAMGLSFSVQPPTPPPSSLQNIYKELEADLAIASSAKPFTRPPHGDLTQWAVRGVLLLNTVLTVQRDKAASHRRQGWEEFTDRIIQKINSEKRGVVFMLWGNHAKSKAALINQNKHCVLTSAHPSGLSAHRGFFGCKHFSKANAYLVGQGLEPIDWSLL